MPKTKQQKEEILKNITDKISESKSVIFANFNGLKVNDIEDFRNKCREEGLSYAVAKKTLFNLALESNKFTQKDVREFEGEVGAIFGLADEVAPAKIAKDFSKGNENLKMLGGVLATEEGFRYMELDEVQSLASLPSKPELLAKAVGSMKSPITGFVNVLAGNMRGLVQVLNSIKEQKV